MEFIAKPFGWLLMRFYELFGNYGVAVIMFALVVKLILLPFQMKGKRSMMQQSRLQPRLKELEKKHGANKAKYQEEVAKMYKEEKINPMSGCIWSLIPLPIIIALFQAIRNPLTTMMGVPKALIDAGGAIAEKLSQLGFATPANANYVQIAQTEFISKHFDSFAGLSDKLSQIDYGFLGLRLGETPNFKFLWETTWSDPSIWVPGLLLFMIPIISGVLAFFSSKVSMMVNKTGDQQPNQMKSMMMLMPLISVYFAFIMPAAIGIYIIASTLFAMIQDIILTKRYTKIMEIEDAAKLEAQRIREAELEAKRLETERKKLENNTERNPNTSKKKQLKVERLEQLEKAAEWEKKNQPVVSAEDPSRSGTRRFARGRAYDPSRYGDDAAESGQSEATEEDTETEQAVLIGEVVDAETDMTEETDEELDEAVDDESVMDDDEEDK